MPRVEKELLAPGVFFTASGPVEFTAGDVRAFHDTTKQMLADGQSIPCPLEHQTSAKPLSHAEKMANSVGFNTGFLANVSMRGNTLVGELDIGWLPGATTDDEIRHRLEKCVRYVSPELYPQWQCGDGKTYNHALTHVALTAQPVWGGQRPFGSSGLVMSLAPRLFSGPTIPTSLTSCLRLSLGDLWYTDDAQTASTVRFEREGDWQAGVKLSQADASRMLRSLSGDGPDEALLADLNSHGFSPEESRAAWVKVKSLLGLLSGV